MNIELPTLNFQLPNPKISVAEIEVPEFNAYVVASRVSSALKRGIHFRRAGYWALSQIMEAGALGAEIIISGKVRTERSRSEKFRDGYLPKSGEAATDHVRKASVHVQLKPGILGVRVAIMPPNIVFPDNVEILQKIPSELQENVEKPAPMENDVEKSENKEVEE